LRAKQEPDVYIFPPGCSLKVGVNPGRQMGSIRLDDCSREGQVAKAFSARFCCALSLEIISVAMISSKTMTSLDVP
jgi:hypothetical protein